jgi:lysyl-tRNA synthetase, class II
VGFRQIGQKGGFVTESRSKFEEIRIEKLRKLEALGVDPWGQRFADRTPIAEIVPLAPEEKGVTTETRVRTAGRILALRDSGKVYFIDLHDKTGRIQLFIGKNQVGEDWNLMPQLDLWDLIGVEGKVGKTKTGEPTIFAEKIHFLTKTLAHPPEKYHKAKDVELLLRRRYIDMIQNKEVLERFETRAKILRHMRTFLDGRGFVEVETPTMQAIAGGAAARPFVTHHNALDIELYLRIAPELYLKRLLVGGMERVYEIARVFRNEGVDATHNPEFTMMELYEAYGNYETMMELTESLIVGLVDMLGKGRVLPWGDKTIDFSPPWRRAKYDDLLREQLGVGLGDAEGLRRVAKERGLETAGKDPDVLAHELFESTCEEGLTNPVFVIDYPASLCPLTKRKADKPNIAERFELYIHGMELANAYTELNDPLLQEELFTSQLQGLSDEDSMAKMDRDFVLALKHGMPPAGGLGIGVDRLCMLLTDSHTIRDTIIFPLLKPKPIRKSADGEAEDDDDFTDTDIEAEPPGG